MQIGMKPRIVYDKQLQGVHAYMSTPQKNYRGYDLNSRRAFMVLLP